MNNSNILNATWMLTKEIMSNFEQRGEYQNLLNEIHQNKPSLVMAMNNRALQFAGLLIIHHNRDQLNRNYIVKVKDDLNATELRDIEEIFTDFHQLNLYCLKPLLKVYPWLETSLIHYCEFNFPIPPTNKGRNVKLISPKKVDQFANIFWSHPCFEIIQKNIGLIKSKYQNAQYFEGIRRPIEKDIENGLIVENPNFKKYSMLDNQSIEKQLLKLVFAIICLRRSIKILNELLYMQIRYDKLPAIDDSNLLKFPVWHVNEVRNGVNLVCLINEKNHFLSQGNWIFYMKKEPQNSGTVLNFCNMMTISVNQEYGEEMEIHADNIDENLNTYPNILL